MLISLVVIALSLLMLLIDWRQTAEILRRPLINEMNPLIRKCYVRWGDRGLRYYFGTCAIIVTVVWGIQNPSETVQTFRIAATVVWWFQQVGWLFSNKELLK